MANVLRILTLALQTNVVDLFYVIHSVFIPFKRKRFTLSAICICVRVCSQDRGERDTESRPGLIIL